MQDFSKYEQMKNNGVSAQAVYQAIKAKEHSFPACVRILRSVFGLSHAEAKEVAVIADGLGASLDDYQSRFVDAIKQFLVPSEDDEG